MIQETTGKYSCIGGATVGTRTIPCYGPVYPYKGWLRNSRVGERNSDPTPTAHVISGQPGDGT